MHTLNLQGVDAVIFDMDGTMVNNNSYHKMAWFEFGKRHNIQLTDQDFKDKLSGRRNKEILTTLLGDLTSEQIQEYAEEKESIYRDLYSKNIREVKGLTTLLDFLKQKGIKIVIATTAPKRNREFVIDCLKIHEFLDLVIGDEHVQKGKPNPEIYLQVANTLNVNPSKCLVFEDSPSGVQAAKKAGMKIVGLLTSHAVGELKGADFCIRDFTELRIIRPKTV